MQNGQVIKEPSQGELTECANGNNGIQANEQEPLEPMALAVANQIVGEENGNKHYGDLKLVEAQIHLDAAHAPADDDEKRNEKEGNLHAGANSDTNGEIHLILDGDGDGGGVLGGVADNGEQDQADKLLSQTSGFRQVVDGVDHVLGTEGNNDCRGEQGSDGHEKVQLRVLFFFLNLLVVVDNGRLLLGSVGVLVLVLAAGGAVVHQGTGTGHGGEALL